MIPLEQTHTLLDARIPVLIVVEDGLGGVTSWSRRLKKAFQDNPKYNLIMVECPVFVNEVTGARDLCCLTREDLHEALAGLRPAIVIPNYAWEAFNLCADLIREGHALRTIGFCRTDEELYYTPLTWYAPLIAQFAAVSPECAEALARRIPHRKDAIHVMPAGVWVPEPLERSYQTAPIRLVYGGRMSQVQKRVLDFVPLVKRLLATGLDFTLDLVGTGSQTEKLKAAISRLNHGGRVRFTGTLPPEAMPGVWRRHDIFLQTSEYEGTSNSMLESMAQGAVPVVTGASSGIRSVLNEGVNGFIVPVGDMAAMARCIAQLAGDPALLARMGAAAHEKSKDYGMDRYRERFTAMLDATLEQPVRTWPRTQELSPEVARLIRPLKRRPGCDCSPTPAAVPMDPPPPRAEPIVAAAAADDRFAMPLAAMVRSIIDHLGPERRVELYVLDGGITDENKARLLRSWEDARLAVHWAPVEHAHLQGLMVSGHVNTLTYARLLIPRLLPESAGKAIYLDADLIVRRDIGELWAMDVRNAALLAAQDMTAPYMDAARALRNYADSAPYLSQVKALVNHEQLGIAPTAKYFNAGVLVFNLDLWREEDLSRKVTSYIRGHRRAVRYWDQDGLNAVLHGQWAEIDGRWNQIPHIFRYPSAQQSPFPPEIFERLRDDPWIVHFATRQKPWRHMDAHVFAADFFAALDRTAWAGWRPPGLENLLRNPGFRDWEDGRPVGWEASGHGAFSLTEGPDGAPAAGVSVTQAAGDACLGQQLETKGDVARSRLLVWVQARCEEPHALSVRVSHVVDGVEQTESRHHAGDGRWHMVRHEIRLPIGTDPRRIRVRIVLRGHAAKSARIAGAFAAIVPPAGGTPSCHTPVTRLAAALPNKLRRLLRKAGKRLR